MRKSYLAFLASSTTVGHADRSFWTQKEKQEWIANQIEQSFYWTEEEIQVEKEFFDTLKKQLNIYLRTRDSGLILKVLKKLMTNKDKEYFQHYIDLELIEQYDAEWEEYYQEEDFKYRNPEGYSYPKSLWKEFYKGEDAKYLNRRGHSVLY